MTPLLFALLLSLVGLLAVALAWAGGRIERLQRELRFNLARRHTLCLMDIKEVVSASHDAALLNRLADRWDSPDEQGNLRILAREKYNPGGPSMPAIWLRQQADIIGLLNSESEFTPERRVGDL